MDWWPKWCSRWEIRRSKRLLGVGEDYHALLGNWVHEKTQNPMAFDLVPPKKIETWIFTNWKGIYVVSTFLGIDIGSADFGHSPKFRSETIQTWSCLSWFQAVPKWFCHCNAGPWHGAPFHPNSKSPLEVPEMASYTVEEILHQLIDGLYPIAIVHWVSTCFNHPRLCRISSIHSM